MVLGCGQPHREQGQNIGRLAAMPAGLPTSVAGVTVSRHCASGLDAIALAAHRIVCDDADAIIAGGVESITLLKPRPFPIPDFWKGFLGFTWSWA